MTLYIAIDDTDNSVSRGTGYRARQLAALLKSLGEAVTSGITRHQLLVNEAIPYTSHNSSACLKLVGGNPEKITYICKTFLLAESATGSDAGLCIAPEGMVNDEIILWGQRAKIEVLEKADAAELAKRSLIYLEGFTGTHGGIIGALAAVGLRKAGNDGRFLWVEGMRKFMGVFRAGDILKRTGVDKISTPHGEPVDASTRILLPEWWRPVLKEGKAVLFIERSSQTNLYEYQNIPKDTLRRISS